MREYTKAALPSCRCGCASSPVRQASKQEVRFERCVVVVCSQTRNGVWDTRQRRAVITKAQIQTGGDGKALQLHYYDV